MVNRLGRTDENWNAVIRGTLADMAVIVPSRGYHSPVAIFVDPGTGTAAEIARRVQQEDGKLLDDLIPPEVGNNRLVIRVHDLAELPAWLPEPCRAELEAHVSTLHKPVWLWVVCLDGDRHYFEALGNPNPGFHAN